MKILCLYNNDCALELFHWLETEGHEVVLHTDRLSADWCREQSFQLTVSYTYRYILSPEIIEILSNNVVNIHNALLPFNRGADPNLWSIIDETPKGVSLHYVSEGLDKGSIIAQTMLNITDDETLASSYNKLDKEAKKLFKGAFQYYDFWPLLKKKTEGEGTYHALKDAADIKRLIDTYDISIAEFKKMLKSMRGGVLQE